MKHRWWETLWSSLCWDWHPNLLYATHRNQLHLLIGLVLRHHGFQREFTFPVSSSFSLAVLGSCCSTPASFFLSECLSHLTVYIFCLNTNRQADSGPTPCRLSRPTGRNRNLINTNDCCSLSYSSPGILRLPQPSINYSLPEITGISGKQQNILKNVKWHNMLPLLIWYNNQSNPRTR